MVPLRAVVASLRAFWVLAISVQGGVGAWSCTTPEQTSSSPKLQPCRINDLTALAECGQLTVKENEDAPLSRSLSIRFAVVPAIASTPRADPLVILVGGPGQAATEAGGVLAAVFSEVRRLRDIVLVDQRGTGGSHALSCDDNNIPLSERFSQEVTAQEVLTCLAAQDADVTQYATPMALSDLEAVRKRLGYERWNLWGGSYGTRVALAYMQRHPNSIRRVILDGAAPTDLELPLHFSRDAEHAFDLALRACADNASCNQAFPNPKANLDQILGALREGPIEVKLTHPNTGHPEKVRISRLGFAAGLRSLLYSADLTALVPLALYQAAEHDNWAPFVTAVAALTDGMADRASYTGMYLSVVCAEDVRRITDQEVREYAGRGFFGGDFVGQLRKACEIWPSAELSNTYFDPVTSDHPTLVLSGELDPATPPRFGKMVSDRLPNSRHLVMRGVGHGVSTVGCIPSVLAEFLEAEAVTAVDIQCADKHQRPAFFTSFTGP